MARIRFRNLDFKPERAMRIVQINKILEEYERAVSVRQLYYRLVAAATIPNEPKEYDKVQDLITDARYAGLIDWDAIEDRGRSALMVKDWENGSAAVNEVSGMFRLNRWDGQPFYVELWVEKAALAGVLSPIAEDYHIPLMVNRGSSSASAMKDSAARVIHHSRPSKTAPHGRRPVILYIGDHDPSGIDMIRDVKARLLEFGSPDYLDVRPIALTMAQVEEYKPPPNPLKRKDDPKKYKVADGSLADPRAQEYVANYGYSSWEADALPPPVLDLITRQAINSYIDKPKMDAIITRENIIKGKLKKFAATFVE